MAIITDTTTAIGKTRLYGGDWDAGTYMFEDDAINTFLGDAGGIVLLASYYLIRAKIALLAANPMLKSMSGYSERYDFKDLNGTADRMLIDLNNQGIAVDGNPIAQFGYGEMARDKASWLRVEMNKALRGQTY